MSRIFLNFYVPLIPNLTTLHFNPRLQAFHLKTNRNSFRSPKKETKLKHENFTTATSYHFSFSPTINADFADLSATFTDNKYSLVCFTDCEYYVLPKSGKLGKKKEGSENTQRNFERNVNYENEREREKKRKRNVIFFLEITTRRGLAFARRILLRSVE